jgi:hypothetical protein
MKRKATFAARAGKKSKGDKRVSVVVDALKDAEALPENLRNLLKVSLPIALNACKVDRHSYENEVVDQAQSALTAVQGALKNSLKGALAAQNAVIAPAERAKRTKAKQDAEAHLEAAKAKLETNKAGKKASEKEVEDTTNAFKAAEKLLKAAEKAVAKTQVKQEEMRNVLAYEFVMVKEGASASIASADGKRAVKKLIELGKQYGLDSTLLVTLPITCKKDVANRTEFEMMMFNSLQALIDGVIKELAAKLTEEDQDRAAKEAAAANANATMEKAKDVFKAASDELEATQAASAEAAKEVRKADANLRGLWEDMRKACDSQDSLAGEVKNFQECILTAFAELKEKEPEPEPVAEEAPPAAAAAEAEPAPAEAAA